MSEYGEFQLKGWLWEILESNRQLTLKVARALLDHGSINARPIPNMRPFHLMLLEIICLERAYMRGLALDDWELEQVPDKPPEDAETSLALAETVREESRGLWTIIPESKLLTLCSDPFFGGPEARPLDWLLDGVENEVHHRGQGYAYLRLLGIEPPPFWER